MTCNTHEIIDNCLVMLSHKMDSIRVNKKYGKEAMVKGNSGKLHQVFLNLLANSIQAIEHKGHIVVTTENMDQDLVVTIEDDGTGMSESTLPQIFDPFFTTKEPGKGTGLGLPISKKIVCEHGGEVNVHSSEGKGSIFTVRLPMS